MGFPPASMTEPRFPMTYCSQCGAELGPGDAGVSHCSDHTAKEPVAYMWQHDETGRIGFIDKWQLENGWEANNPRNKIVGPLFLGPNP